MYSEILGQVVRVLSLTAVSFITAMLLTPVLSHFLYKYKIGKQIRTEGAPIFTQMHQKKSGTPTMGGILVWFVTGAIALILWILSLIFDGFWNYLNFVSRPQTYLPIFSLLVAALIGFSDDLLGVLHIGPKGGGLKVRHKLVLFAVIAAVGAWWFYFKLGWDFIHIPFLGDIALGPWYILVFFFMIIATAFSTNETDGLDGLAGGVLLFAYLALCIVAFVQGKYDLAVLTGVISGALIAFLWFNVYPARFFMGDTGSMALGITLGILVMLTNTALLLPFFGFILVVESLSVIIQMTSKKIRHKKVFLSTPIHHHLEAIGWPETKITMRFWILSAVATVFGLIIFFVDKFL